MNIMTNELINLMQQMVTQTEKDKKIRGILLCKREDGMIVPSNVSVGDEFKLPKEEIEKMIYPKNTTKVGIYRSYSTCTKVAKHIKNSDC